MGRIRIMTGLLATAALVVAALVLPALASAAPSGTDRANAARECRAERAAMGVEAFRQKYGTNRNRRNAFGKCVSRTAREEEREREVARRNAAQQCKAERAMPEAEFRQAHGGKSFAELYGTNRNGRNAYGKCVSLKARQNKQAADEQDRRELNAARACRAEQRLNPEAFALRYGTNRNRRNAFGKCVSQRASQQPSG